MKTNKIVDKKLSKQVRIETGLHELLLKKAKASKMSLKSLIEGFIIDGLAKDKL